MFPRAYSIYSSNPGYNEICIKMASDEGRKKLNINDITLRLFFNQPSKIRIKVEKYQKADLATLRDRFVSKDPENYEKLINEYDSCLVISTENYELTKGEAVKLVDDFFNTLFAPDMRESLLPLYPEDLKDLQMLLKNNLHYHMPPVTLTPWTPGLFAKGSVAKEAQDAKEIKEQECTWSI